MSNNAIATVSDVPQVAPDRPAKRQKVAIACDICRAKKVKCDGLRPVCSPCARRADRGVPCEYTSEVRTSHGPSKGYVHHLELKLRELQAEKDLPSPSQVLQSYSDKSPQQFSAINRPPPIKSTWLSATTGQETHARPPTDYEHSRTSSYNYQSSNRGFVNSEITNSISRPDQQPYPHLPEPKSILPPKPPTPTPRHGPLVFKKVKPASDDRGNSRVGLPGIPYDLKAAYSNSVDLRLKSDPRPSYIAGVPIRVSFTSTLKSAVEAKVRSSPAASTPPTRPSPLPPSTKMQFNHSIEYVLPSRRTADTLVRKYWDVIQPTYPILDQQDFEQSYESIWTGTPSSNESLFMSTLNALFALAAQHSEEISIEQRERLCDQFFDRAQELLQLDLWDAG